MSFDVAVIGGGPAGYACAIRLGQKGKKVVLFEKDKVGGECLNYGCIPSKALIELAGSIHHLRKLSVLNEIPKFDMSDWQSWKQRMVNRLTGGVKILLKSYGVEIVQGNAEIVDRNHVRSGEETHEFQDLVIATGSSPVKFPNFEGVFYNKEILDVDHIPESLVVIGGGYIGVELGTAFAKLGTAVTIVEMMDTILPGIETTLSSVVGKELNRLGVRVLTSSKVKGVTAGEKRIVEMEDGEKIESEVVLLTVGRVPNTTGFGLEKLNPEMDGRFIKVNKRMQTNIQGVYAIGDVCGQPMLAHKAYNDADIAADNICGEERESDYRAMPIVVYSDPEIAYTGKKGEKETFYPVAANGRALGMNVSSGFYRIYYRDGGAITGAGIVAPHASELITEISLAVEAGLSLEDIGMTIHPHPSLSEGIHESAEGGYRKQLHYKTVN